MVQRIHSGAREWEKAWIMPQLSNGLGVSVGGRRLRRGWWWWWWWWSFLWRLGTCGPTGGERRRGGRRDEGRNIRGGWCGGVGGETGRKRARGRERERESNDTIVRSHFDHQSFTPALSRPSGRRGAPRMATTSPQWPQCYAEGSQCWVVGKKSYVDCVGCGFQMPDLQELKDRNMHGVHRATHQCPMCFDTSYPRNHGGVLACRCPASQVRRNLEYS